MQKNFAHICWDADNGSLREGGLRLHLTIADAAEKPLREQATAAGFTGEGPRDALPDWLHHLAGVERPRNGDIRPGGFEPGNQHGPHAPKAKKEKSKPARPLAG